LPVARHLESTRAPDETRPSAASRAGRLDGGRADRRLVRVGRGSAAATSATDHAPDRDAAHGDRPSGDDACSDDARGNHTDGDSAVASSAAEGSGSGCRAGRCASRVERLPASESAHHRKHSGRASRDEPGTCLPAPSRS
jgi:hypothetical protein